MIYFELFWLFLYFGCLCFGGGSSLVPFFIEELVNQRHWMSMQELTDFLAISQVTPGPISVNSATFFGFRQGGFAGGAVATAALLLPSYFLMILGISSLKKWEKNRIVQGILCGIRPATLGLMLATFIYFLEMSVLKGGIPWQQWYDACLGRAAESGDFGIRWAALPIFAVSFCLFYRNKISIVWVIFSAAAAGALLCR